MHENISQRKQAEEEMKELNDQLKKLNKHINEIREQERIEISREIHDELGQVLTHLKIDIGRIARKIPDKSIQEETMQVFSKIDNTIIAVQRIIASMKPEWFDEFGLPVAIKSYCNDFENKTAIQISTDIELEVDLPNGISLNIYRILQESLTNIIRHSKAGSVNLLIKADTTSLYFSISDNGLGISVEKLNSKKSFGINGMKARIVSMGGSFEINSTQEIGTDINIFIPLQNNMLHENINL
jgi:two-component system, sensor histidine kinase